MARPRTGLFDVDSRIAIVVPTVRRTTVKRARRGRPWVSDLTYYHSGAGGVIRFARIVKQREESIVGAEVNERLETADSVAGIKYPGWAHGEWIYNHFDEIPEEQGWSILRERIREEGLRVIFPGTDVHRSFQGSKFGSGFPALLQGNHKLDFHVLGTEQMLHILVACFIPEGVILDD